MACVALGRGCSVKRHDQKGRSKGDPKHTRLYEYMLASEAWRSLSTVERALYLEIKRRYNSKNNGFLAMSAREAGELLLIGKSTAARALRLLEERGFISCARRGGFNCKVSHASLWRLTEAKCDATGELPTKEFMRWRPGAQEGVEKQNTVPSQVRAVPVVGQYGT